MSENLNINNLTLDDNTFTTLPDGDYHFTVKSHEIGYYSGDSDKIPPNTQVVTVYLEIPYLKEGSLSYCKVKNNLNIYKKALFAIRQFTDCIGLTPEKGKASINLESMDDHEGICNIERFESKNGNEYNRVKICYAPSKAPTITLNDEAWKMHKDNDGFMTVEDDGGLSWN